MMRKTALCAIAIAIVLSGCKCKKDGKEASPEGQQLLPSKGEVSFSPDGQMYVFTSGTSLVIRKVGDDRTFWLTAEPPVEEKKGEGKEPAGDEATKAAEEKCVPAKPGDPLPGPQGGWQGQASWSPDGSFIAFMAPWKDGNCAEGDDVDWDIWVVDVSGLDLATWVTEVVGEKPEGGSGEPKKDYYITGPAGAGLSYYQVSSTVGTEQRPTWVTCRAIAYSTEDAVVKEDLAGIPGACEMTAAEEIAVCERRASELERSHKQMEKQCSVLDATGAAPGVSGSGTPEAKPAPAKPDAPAEE